MIRRGAGAFSVLLIVLAVFGLETRRACSSPPDAGEHTDDRSLAFSLVKQLGDEQFAARERAADQLVKLGVSAIPALEEGSKNADREVRYRSRRILAMIRETDFQRRLEAFAAGRDGEGGLQLPGWSRFQEAFGNDTAARSLFVEMQKAEPELLSATQRGPEAVGEMISQRTQELRQSMRMLRQQLTLGNVAALLFAAGDEQVAVTDEAAQSLYAYCYQPSFSTAMEAGAKREILRKLLGLWVRRSHGWGAYQGMMLAAQYNLKDGIVPAEQVLRDRVNSAQIRQLAILIIAKLGDESHLPLLESFLNDQTPCALQQLQDAKYVTQIRDVALAALIHLVQANPKEFGFDRVKRNDEYLLTADSLGFATEEERASALEKWRGFRKERKKPAASP